MYSNDKKYKQFLYFFDISYQELSSSYNLVNFTYKNIIELFDKHFGVSFIETIKNFDELIKKSKEKKYSLEYEPSYTTKDAFGKIIQVNSAELNYFDQLLKSLSSSDIFTKNRRKKLMILFKLGKIQQLEFLINNFSQVEKLINKETRKFKKENIIQNEKKKELLILTNINNIYNSLLNIKNFNLIDGFLHLNKEKLENFDEEEMIKLINAYSSEYSIIIEYIQNLIYLINLKKENSNIKDYQKYITEFIKYLEKEQPKGILFVEIQENKKFDENTRREFLKTYKNHPIIKLFGSKKLIKNEDKLVIEKKRKIQKALKETDKILTEGKIKDKELLEKLKDLQFKRKKELEILSKKNFAFEKLINLSIFYDNYLENKNTIKIILENNNTEFSIKNIKNAKIKDIRLFEKEIIELYKKDYKDKYKTLEEFKIYLFKLNNQALKKYIKNSFILKEKNNLVNEMEIK